MFSWPKKFSWYKAAMAVTEPYQNLKEELKQAINEFYEEHEEITQRHHNAVGPRKPTDLSVGVCQMEFL